MDAELLTISELVHKAISDHVFPGAAIAFGTCSVPCFYEAFGTYTYESSLPISEESIWDLASLTKIMATVPAVMLLYDRALIDLDAAVALYLPDWARGGKEAITVRMLLSHTAGLREFHPFFSMGLTTPQQVCDFLMAAPLHYSAGVLTRYSDVSMIVLGWVVESLVHMPLAQFVHNELYKPLGMTHTHFRSVADSDFDPRVVPTEVDIMHRRRLLWGEVHDPTAWILGGAAGHAGLFSSVLDVSQFAQMLLAGGVDLRNGRRYFKSSTVQLFISQNTPTAKDPRPFALGWDVASRRGLDGYTSAGKYMGPKTFGHTGFTGTSLWMDPESNFFVVMLTNSVHPTVVDVQTKGDGWSLRQVRPLIADACFKAMVFQALPWDSLNWLQNQNKESQV